MAPTWVGGAADCLGIKFYIKLKTHPACPQLVCVWQLMKRLFQPRAGTQAVATTQKIHGQLKTCICLCGVHLRLMNEEYAPQMYLSGHAFQEVRRLVRTSVPGEFPRQMQSH